MPPILFSEIEEHVEAGPGIYEIYLHTGLPLKVGISNNLLKRLIQHRDSKQHYLKRREGGDISNPRDVLSKRSILAKHLYYDQSITTEYDLTSEPGRQSFLKEKCYIIFETTATRAEAREIEIQRELHGSYRYVGRVIVR